MKELTPVVPKDLVDQGVELAWQANLAFDALEAEVDGTYEHWRAKQIFSQLENAVGDLIGWDTVGGLERDGRFDFLSPEQKLHARKVTFAMAEKYELDARDIHMIVMEDADGQKQAAVVLAASHPQITGDGSWESVFGETANTPDYLIEVDGEEIDTRQMDDHVIQALYVDEKHRGKDPHARMHSMSPTWLKGKPGTDGTVSNNVAIAHPADKALHIGDHPGKGNNRVRFRPTVIIG